MTGDRDPTAATPAPDPHGDASGAPVPPDEPTTIASALDVGGSVGTLARQCLDTGLAGLTREEVLEGMLELLGFDVRGMNSRDIVTEYMRHRTDVAWPDFGEASHCSDNYVRHALGHRLEQHRSKKGT